MPPCPLIQGASSTAVVLFALDPAFFRLAFLCVPFIRCRVVFEFPFLRERFRFFFYPPGAIAGLLVATLHSARLRHLLFEDSQLR